jgi:Spy/CpxP family protein refolding chaperone
MNIQDIPALPPSASEQNEHDEASCPHRRRHGFVAGLVLGVIGAGLIGFAIGATMPVAEAAFSAIQSSRFGAHPDGPPTAEEARDHAEFFVAFALHRLDATPDQQERVTRIVDGAVDELFPIVEKHRANRDELHTVLEASTVDRAAIEKLRVQEVALADNLSRVIASAVGDAAEVLTTEQRSELIQNMERFRHHP